MTRTITFGGVLATCLYLASTTSGQGRSNSPLAEAGRAITEVRESEAGDRSNSPSAEAGRAITEVREFEAGGPRTFTVPRNVNRIMVELWGAGGGGGGATGLPRPGLSTLWGGGGGGGAGAYARYYLDVTQGQTIHINVGNAGIGGHKIVGHPGEATDGDRGGDTTVIIGSTTMKAAGGEGGKAPTVPASLPADFGSIVLDNGGSGGTRDAAPLSRGGGNGMGGVLGGDPSLTTAGGFGGFTQSPTIIQPPKGALGGTGGAVLSITPTLTFRDGTAGNPGYVLISW